MTPPALPTPRSRRTRLRRILPAVLGLAIAAVALSGCVSLVKVDFSQQGAIGNIDLVVTACGSSDTAPVCPKGSSNLVSNNTSQGQVLFGVLIDARFVAPAGFTTNFPEQQPFTASPDYTAELNRLAPPDPGLKWAGYISDARTYTPGKQITARIPIGRPLLPDGSPPSGSFGASWVIGSRGVLADAPASRPVSCGSGLSTVNTVDLTICRDSSGGGGGNGFNDFAFLTPATATVQAGQTAVIPVTGKLSGPADPAINFALAASTTLPGATALTNVPTLAPPGESTTSVAVSVPVPASAAPGTYAVTLKGTLSTGETRSTTGTLVVTRPATGGAGAGGGGGATAPRLSGLKVSRKTIFNWRGAAPSVISVNLSAPGRLNVLLERQAPGLKSRGRCVIPTSKLRRAGAARCTRYIKVSTSTRFGLAAGVAKTNISGRAAGRPRLTGTYRVTLTTTGAGGTSLPLRTTLNVRG